MQELLPVLQIRILEPIGKSLGLPLLSQHLHETAFFFVFYHVVYEYVSPKLSTRYFSQTYPKFNKKSRVDWDVHAVSLTQCTLISMLTIYCIIFDQERKDMGFRDRVWSYTGATNTLIGIANGYFVWHFLHGIRYVQTYGWSMVAHAVACLVLLTSAFVSYPSPNP